jgi:hypothetical protein
VEGPSSFVTEVTTIGSLLGCTVATKQNSELGGFVGPQVMGSISGWENISFKIFLYIFQCLKVNTHRKDCQNYTTPAV